MLPAGMHAYKINHTHVYIKICVYAWPPCGPMPASLGALDTVQGW